MRSSLFLPLLLGTVGGGTTEWDLFYVNGDHEHGLGQEGEGVVLIEKETYFEGGGEEQDAADFDGEGAYLLSSADEEVLEDVADDGEACDACIS